jgi:hypothetical protein
VGNKLIWIILRPIKAGTPLTRAINERFFNQKIEERRQEYKLYYGWNCYCEACMDYSWIDVVVRPYKILNQNPIVQHQNLTTFINKYYSTQFQESWKAIAITKQLLDSIKTAEFYP